MTTPKVFLDQAINANRAAVCAEKEERYGDAFEYYKQACLALSLAAKYESFSSTKKKYEDILRDMLTRAEYIRTQLSAPQVESAVAEENNPSSKTKKSDNEEDRNLQEALKEAILQEKPCVHWSDVAGLEQAKQSLKEAVVLPIRFPELFVGKRRPWKGILLFGPPGTGKSFLAKAVATEVDATFFSVSSADLMSKWVGQSEKLVRALFELAREHKPSIVFIDEIDSIAGKRGDGDSESSRRVKTELLIQMQGVGSQNDGILFLGATNTPWDLDTAVIRRFDKRIHVGLPDERSRETLFRLHLGDTPNTLTNEDFKTLAMKSEGYSGSDIGIVVQDALMQPIRRLQSTTHFKQIETTESDGTVVMKWMGVAPNEEGSIETDLLSIPRGCIVTPPVTMMDVYSSLLGSRSSVSESDIKRCLKWMDEFGMSA
ncbi:Vacuolar protein sorting 4A (Vps4A) [Monocercomonoides exilis]|uniref:Vacuolar protein sorting 4A (Vps4A) n=1 Tax=Monocercomonoides exilis TaxID=2049356 RepID=UPI00355AC3E0|nr:Vacuolar protein sorting 4A (Vps4A) [Monocercomonoides exilis]|eukprot:MONOS_3650.1-p1 / transcript=MONOS_3650.1 / gene=MONOS_3650 / organism=Monocercomonoides_exilis_PA203 / gene_product= Vacuolar protein sorting 4A (Vps4A) / transcript_product= Vacuolar protein sorting 4A (Vps4A) / location=Mono_scaffold00088:10775-12264(-) / protein_length=430 / sequence_SO=supercontig / SO=protein_coding / is_pseudo=false